MIVRVKMYCEILKWLGQVGFEPTDPRSKADALSQRCRYQWPRSKALLNWCGKAVRFELSRGYSKPVAAGLSKDPVLQVSNRLQAALQTSTEVIDQFYDQATESCMAKYLYCWVRLTCVRNRSRPAGYVIGTETILESFLF